jgi:hypothetical protein
MQRVATYDNTDNNKRIELWKDRGTIVSVGPDIVWREFPGCKKCGERDRMRVTSSNFIDVNCGENGILVPDCGNFNCDICDLRRGKEIESSNYYLSLPKVHDALMRHGFYQYCQDCMVMEKTLPDSKIYSYTSKNNKKKILDIYMDDDGKGLVFTIRGGSNDNNREIIWRNRPKCEAKHCHRSRCIVWDGVVSGISLDPMNCEIGRHLPHIGGFHSCTDGCMKFDSCFNLIRRNKNINHGIIFNQTDAKDTKTARAWEQKTCRYHRHIKFS